MICKKCGTKNDKSSKYCSNCGSKIKKGLNYKKWMIILLIVLGMIFILPKTISSIKEYVDIKRSPLSQEVNPKNDDDKTQSNNQDDLNGVEKENDEEVYDNEENNDEEINSKIINLVDNLQFNYDIAINTGDVSKVYPYITKTGNLYSSYTKNIPLWHDEGMRTVTEEVEYTDVELNYDGTYKVGRYSICKVSRKDVVVYEKEYIDFIITKENGKFLVESCKNYKMIDNNYDY